MNVLLSIKPEYVEKIFSGEKQFEYRKAIFKLNVRKIIVYSTKPVGMIVGEFQIDGILEEEPQIIWEKTKDHSGVDEAFFYRYFEGKKKAYAIRVGSKTLYKNPLDPYVIYESFTPPQFFRYIDDSSSRQTKMFPDE